MATINEVKRLCKANKEVADQLDNWFKEYGRTTNDSIRINNAAKILEATKYQLRTITKQRIITLLNTGELNGSDYAYLIQEYPYIEVK